MAHKLLIDAGNTRVKAALMDSEGHLEPWFNADYDELAQHVISEPLDGVWIAAVSGQQQNEKLSAWLSSQKQSNVVRIHSEASAFGITNAYEQPAHLGVDRWLAMLGAYDEQPKATVIIDAGTAITVDWIDENGRHLGGWIAPGVELMKNSVTQRAPNVFSDQTSQWGKAQQLGLSTPECLLNGCVNTFVGLVRQAIAVSETELDWFDYRILLSGGSIPLLPVDIKRRGEIRTELVLQGLACYARQEKSTA
ncbi:MAG: type III pantothenate kinase [Gammaproteobacteria bacterium]|jgi:type III pantothenate kinase|nr:type III pantothenate kinase [Gammaproteobacteria bacterium]